MKIDDETSIKTVKCAQWNIVEITSIIGVYSDMFTYLHVGSKEVIECW